MANPINPNPPIHPKQSDKSDKLDKHKGSVPPFNPKKRDDKELGSKDEDSSDSDSLQSPLPVAPKQSPHTTVQTPLNRPTNAGINTNSKSTPAENLPSPFDLAGKKPPKKEKEEDNQQDSGSGQGSGVVPMPLNVNPNTGSSVAQVDAKSGVNDQIADLAQQISDYIDSANITQTNSETVLSVTISSSGIFNNAQVQLTTVGGEHNISFVNLSQQAQEILENNVNKANLFKALDDNGIKVHQISTERSESLSTNETQPDKQDEGDQEESNGGESGRGQQQKG